MGPPIGPPEWKVGDRWTYAVGHSKDRYTVEVTAAAPESYQLVITHNKLRWEGARDGRWVEEVDVIETAAATARRPDLAIATVPERFWDGFPPSGDPLAPWPLAPGTREEKLTGKCDHCGSPRRWERTIDEQEVNVPAGTFKAFRIAEGTTVGPPATHRYGYTGAIRWYSPIVGNIVQVVRDVGPPSIPYYLASYRRA